MSEDKKNRKHKKQLSNFSNVAADSVFDSSVKRNKFTKTLKRVDEGLETNLAAKSQF